MGYIRRTRWEARVQAAELARVLYGDGKKREDKKPAEQMLGEFGVTIK